MHQLQRARTRKKRLFLVDPENSSDRRGPGRRPFPQSPFATRPRAQAWAAPSAAAVPLAILADATEELAVQRRASAARLPQRVHELVDRGDREARHGELAFELAQGALLPLTALLPVDGHHEPGELDARGGPQERDRLADRGPGRGHVLDDHHALAVARLVTHQPSALAVVLLLLAVEAEGRVATMLARKGQRRRDHERDALVGRSEQDLEAVAQARADRVGVERAEALDLAPAAEAGEVHEVGRAPAALRLEV